MDSAQVARDYPEHNRIMRDWFRRHLSPVTETRIDRQLALVSWAARGVDRRGCALGVTEALLRRTPADAFRAGLESRSDILVAVLQPDPDEGWVLSLIGDEIVIDHVSQ
ncbi:MAG TPA: hypothetical protein VJO33_14795 [Gemmatimonadaceae bacterium]|nr:hypothetical protein [Gemmatimonadaceae bacterium]